MDERKITSIDHQFMVMVVIMIMMMSMVSYVGQNTHALYGDDGDGTFQTLLINGAKVCRSE